MLISFTLENWMSFRDPVTFSMLASKERQHNDRLPKLKKYQTRVLPIAALYGGNASGKSNFFSALTFAKWFVTTGPQKDNRIPTEPFQLDQNSLERPSRFCFELLVDNTIYEFSFAITHEAVVEEKLVRINSTSEKVLYERRDGRPNLARSLANQSFLQFAFQGTRDNQLFLNNAVSQRVDDFRPIHDWFQNTLELIDPDTRFAYFETFLDPEHPRYAAMNELLSILDTGIAHLGGEPVPMDNLDVPPDLRQELQEKIKDGNAARLHIATGDERIFVTREEGELAAKKLVAYHTGSGGRVPFEFRQESDGSRRIIDLLPAFLELSDPASQKVFVIDEIDRSLHTLLIRRLVEMYLAECTTTSRNQLFLTTHDVLLMDQQLLRRDEMWITERDAAGVSDLIPFSDYTDIRYDKDIRKSYLQGRLGGIPRLMSGASLAVHEDAGTYNK